MYGQLFLINPKMQPSWYGVLVKICCQHENYGIILVKISSKKNVITTAAKIVLNF